MDELQDLSQEAKAILNIHIEKRLSREYSTGFFHGILASALITILSVTVVSQIR